VYEGHPFSAGWDWTKDKAKDKVFDKSVDTAAKIPYFGIGELGTPLKGAVGLMDPWNYGVTAVSGMICALGR
jgi:hypothetical protein